MNDNLPADAVFCRQILNAGVSEWQTRQTQNLLSERACGFESHRRHDFV